MILLVFINTPQQVEGKFDVVGLTQLILYIESLQLNNNIISPISLFTILDENDFVDNPCALSEWFCHKYTT